MDVQVKAPGSQTSSGLTTILGSSEVVFTCELRAEHFADPGETKTQTLRWAAPATAGSYEARAGLRGGESLTTLSAPVTITLQ